MPTHSPPAGHERDVAFVSGPRTVSNVPPKPFVTTISQWLIAIERNGPALSLCACQTRSMNGESDDLSSNVKIEFSVECNHTPQRKRESILFLSAPTRRPTFEGEPPELQNGLPSLWTHADTDTVRHEISQRIRQTRARYETRGRR